ncbi:Disulfide bond formation protein DsbB [Thalassovita gelatinovora]|uniref:Disulfide bond formation protein DsbB n=1 Tax=Thalassovita gelatinovora TaxID=53501 RepID=A0A0P1FML9_THAGE|nr:disulfide bond formation protein B [Thalassovita gelatinovora]QIZ79373.1 disulfide bond formation protein B [Thalassovita gelatinovora]CUH62676.1 Disulfide bond formation protein DsbB [Thalassovita gelatinovora]SEQ08340.1 Disulfide bond formation protein DsbB [Thalassovita gelatinovora]
MITQLDRKSLISLATTGSCALLGGAFLFQFFGYAPCELCLWQRWPHGAAILVGAVALSLGYAGLAWLGALAAVIAGGLGVYHTGVERHWWQGPDSCTGSGGLDMTSLLSTDGSNVVLCDQVSWQMLGLSMASWNALASFGLVILWLMAARRRD